MKKNNKNKIFKYIFMTLFFSFLIVYFSELTGYYEYQNNKKSSLTAKQIQQFENDVALGKEIDLNEYISINQVNYNNNLSKLASKLSNGISILVQNGVEGTFKFLSKLVVE